MLHDFRLSWLNRASPLHFWLVVHVRSLIPQPLGPYFELLSLLLLLGVDALLVLLVLIIVYHLSFPEVLEGARLQALFLIYARWSINHHFLLSGESRLLVDCFFLLHKLFWWEIKLVFFWEFRQVTH